MLTCKLLFNRNLPIIKRECR